MSVHVYVFLLVVCLFLSLVLLWRLSLAGHRSLHEYFYAALGSFWDMARRETSRAQRPPVAGGGEPDLWSGEKMLSGAQARARDTRDAARDRGGSQSRLTGDGPHWEVEHGFY